MAIAAGLSLLLAAAGLVREVRHVDWNDEAGRQRLAVEVTRRVRDRSVTLDGLTQRIARDATLVSAAASSLDERARLFAVLAELARERPATSALAVWIPIGPGSTYRVLAWSDGPGEDVPSDLLAGASAARVLPGAGGLRLVRTRPIDWDGRRVGVAVAESRIAQAAGAVVRAHSFRFATSIGDIPVWPAGTVEASDHTVRVSDAAGTPLLDALVRPGDLGAARRILRWQAAALAILPWAAWMLLVAAGLLGRRWQAATDRGWMGWTLVVAALISIAAGLVIGLARAAHLPPSVTDLLLASALLAVSALTGGSAWWRAWRPRGGSRRRGRWVVEHGMGGAGLALALWTMAATWRARITPETVGQWQGAMLSTDPVSTSALASVLLTQVSVCWAVAGLLGALASRWRLSADRGASWVAAMLWIAPPLALGAASAGRIPWSGTVTVLLAASLFGLSALWIRWHHRKASEARRLVLRFAALVVPVFIGAPFASAAVDDATRAVIAHDYGPATQRAQQPEALMATLATAQRELDALTDLPDLLRLTAPPGAGRPSGEAASAVWAQTVLSRDRVTSEIALYGPDRSLTSRFSLNVPEFGSLYPSGESIWQGAGCEWAAFAEAARFGAAERRMLHAERGVCAPDGTFLGAIVLHIIPDYRTLPFVASANPYYDVLASGDAGASGSRIADLHVVVYGWSLQPVFVSGRVSWSIDPEVDRRLTRSRDPFWQDLSAAGRQFHVYFLNDRLGVYAIGYATPTPLQQTTRLAEAAALMAALFVIYLAGGTLLGALVAERRTPLGRLFVEIRQSFYRKLFLFFVVAAVGPVVLFAIAFGASMNANLRADIESEAASVAVVARRVFDELSAAQAQPGQARPGPSDDMMVWIRQMIDQDVNLYEGARLTATSQRDLFDSGLLPPRTPAAIYRDVVLNRRPVSVAEDRIVDFRYLVAATAIPSIGSDAVLTVPLASRQRDIEREIDELSRGVLAGAALLVLFAAALGASVAARVSDPVARLTRATRLVAAGRLDERIVADATDELGRLVEDFNTMTETLRAQRAELARTHELRAWADMSRQVAHEVKNPLTPIQLAAEHLQRLNADRGRPLGPAADQCVSAILTQVRLLRRIASEFSTFASDPVARREALNVRTLIEGVLEPYRAGLSDRIRLDVRVSDDLPRVHGDRTLLGRALTNLVENALQAMPAGGDLRVAASADDRTVTIDVTDTGVGMETDVVARAFEPYFSTKTGGTGLGLANAKRNVEHSGGTVTLSSAPGCGTTLRVSLPIHRPGESATVPPRPR